LSQRLIFSPIVAVFILASRLLTC